VIAALLLAAAAAAGAVAGDAALLPAAGAVAGCARSGAPEVYPGAELYGLINGGAELFLELGFASATVQRYACAGQEVSLELYRMDDAAAALGVYLAKCGRETPDPALPARHTVGRLQLQLVRGDLYVAATGERAGDALRPALLGLAGAAVAAVPDAAADPLAALPRAGLVAGTERVIRGPFALQAIVTLGEGDILRLQDGRVTALAGEYTDTAGARFSRVVADYPAEADAAAAFAAVRDGLDEYLTVIERSDARLVLRDHAARFVVVVRRGARLEVLGNLATSP
jgi:hypothetical protein